jgi:hypothetical protein
MRSWRDQDGDGISNRRDRDMDGDGMRDRSDHDRDNDGVRNGRDRHPRDARRDYAAAWTRQAGGVRPHACPAGLPD